MDSNTTFNVTFDIYANMDATNVTTNATFHTHKHVIADLRIMAYSVIHYVTCTLSVLAVLTNVITLLVLYRFCGKLSSHHVLIVVQCWADLLMALAFVVEFAIICPGGFCHRLPYSVQCVQIYIHDLSASLVMLTLINSLLITTDRLIAVWKPLTYTTIVRKSRVRAVALTLIVLTPITACIPAVYAAIAAMNGNIMHTFCTVSYATDHIGFNKAIKYWIFLDTVVMVVVYSYILHTIRRQTAQHDLQGISSHKATMTSLWIVMTFLVCYWPYVITRWYDFRSDDMVVWCLYYGSLYLPYVNCLLDPIIYALRLKKVQDGFRALRKCVCH
jgi:hypothetical protein